MAFCAPRRLLGKPRRVLLSDLPNCVCSLEFLGQYRVKFICHYSIRSISVYALLKSGMPALSLGSYSGCLCRNVKVGMDPRGRTPEQKFSRDGPEGDGPLSKNLVGRTRRVIFSFESPKRPVKNFALTVQMDPFLGGLDARPPEVPASHVWAYRDVPDDALAALLFVRHAR
ncbi:hypothetical protein CRG98_030361 [Punica granatum]|uniref:Uncharacterized protein n=1 Tax=Punica granatum TaxID=22663 RepID=A0A2I0IZ31_PUNGR|nr:hypothetical protein CRG98_030361 [Punica granatum]